MQYAHIIEQSEAEDSEPPKHEIVQEIDLSNISCDILYTINFVVLAALFILKPYMSVNRRHVWAISKRSCLIYGNLDVSTVSHKVTLKTLPCNQRSALWCSRFPVNREHLTCITLA